ncbi:MAG: hypothetical protein M3162_09040 [Thermoproteota archaeon]|nr:hypothetical protein [Thermoproteota archaeon]
MDNSNSDSSSFNWQDNSLDWKEMIKKEARGYEKGDDLGEVQEIGQEFVVTQRGRISKHKFYLPKNLVKGYDGDTLWFNITEEDAEDNFKKERPPKQGEYSRYRQYNIQDPASSSGQPSSASAAYNYEERLPRIEKQNRPRRESQEQEDGEETARTATAATATAAGIEDWDTLMNKGVRTKDMQSVGVVTAVTDTSIVITSEGARDEFNVPKGEVEGFNGSEVTLNATYDRFEQFRVKVPR